MTGREAPPVDLPSLDDVERAAALVRPRLVRTPVVRSFELADALGVPVLLKAELLQRTGSFKVRGVLNRLAALTDDERARGVATVSAGNHAIALAFGCAEAGVDCLVVTWQGASETKLAAVRALGGAVDQVALDPTGAFERLAELIAETGRTLVHPYDDRLVAAGAGTVGLELAEDVPDVDLVVVPVGGGGLLTGVAAAVRALRPEARIVAVEPEGSAALGAGLAAGRPVPIQPRSLADGLNAPITGRLTLAAATALGVEHVTVREDELADGMRFLYGRAKLACEPAAAAATAALLAGRIDVEGVTSAVALVSGGNVDPERASAILAGR
ncbi:MAG: pyridoxal-phosphate dependent enzyme [Thermoleophilia bacterium]